MNWYKLANSEGITLGPYSNLQKLGCGENGCVYLDPATGHVIKDTPRAIEAIRASEILQNPSLAEKAPAVYAVHPFGDRFLIERENIKSISEEQMNFMDDIQWVLEDTDYDMDAFSERADMEFDDPERAIKIAIELVSLIKWVEANGWGANDVRGDNIGIRDGNLVIRDLDL